MCGSLLGETDPRQQVDMSKITIALVLACTIAAAAQSSYDT